MLYLISYDIRDNKKRVKVMKYLKNWGYHLQKSVFVGDSPERSDAEEVYREVSDTADLKTDRVFMAPLCAQCFDKKLSAGEAVRFEEAAWVI